ncbi:hypothetical protein GP5015_2239 [gamma proteobacterium HTCC5015]|nr:hypothetical protein GP5015_2239 [gamma proteobacterium HTCC5015]
MGSVHHINKAQLPQSLFWRMLNSMSTNDLASLPIEQFPDQVPDEWLDQLSEDKREVLENRIFESASLRLRHRIALSERYGELVADAVAMAAEGNSKTLKQRFIPRLETLQIAYTHWQIHADSHSRQQLDSGLEQLESVSRDLKSEAQNIAACKAALDNIPDINADDRKEIHAASIDLQHQMNATQQAISEYFTLRLLTQGLELQRANQNANKNEADIRSLEREIRILDRKAIDLVHVYQLSDEQARANSDIQMLRSKAQDLREQLKQLQGFISEAQLLEWLDMVVDASINSLSSTQHAESFQQAQMALFQLLVRYCRAQENAAREVANAPFCQVDPADTIRFMFKSEAFILNYFNSKRKELGDWLGDAAKSKQQALDTLQEQLLHDLQQTLENEPSEHTARPS